jgi:hypothetical protein
MQQELSPDGRLLPTYPCRFLFRLASARVKESKGRCVLASRIHNTDDTSGHAICSAVISPRQFG